MLARFKGPGQDRLERHASVQTTNLGKGLLVDPQTKLRGTAHLQLDGAFGAQSSHEMTALFAGGIRPIFQHQRTPVVRSVHLAPRTNSPVRGDCAFRIEGFLRWVHSSQRRASGRIEARHQHPCPNKSRVEIGKIGVVTGLQCVADHASGLVPG